MANKVIKWKKGRAQPFEARKITKKELKDSTQLEMNEDLEWTKANNFTVNADNLSDEVIELLTKDPDFTVSEINRSSDDDDKTDGDDASGDAGQDATKVADADVPATTPTNVAKKAASSTPGR